MLNTVAKASTNHGLTTPHGMLHLADVIQGDDSDASTVGMIIPLNHKGVREVMHRSRKEQGIISP